MAQERKKRRIVLASILKPVDDTRMMEKIGASLARAGHEVIIIGYPSQDRVVPEGIQIIPLDPFPRISFKRVLAKWKVYNLARKLRPDIFIYCSHELMAPAAWLRLMGGTKTIYDVRENYYRNILMSDTFPFLIRYPLAFIVRLREKAYALLNNHFFLAEKGYIEEIHFPLKSVTVLQNKAIPAQRKAEAVGDGEIRLLFSGTIAESTGVFEAIRMTEGLHAIDSSVTLTIAGYAALPSTLARVLEEIRTRPYIRLIGGDNLVPHRIILQLIGESHAGILSYPRSPHIQNSRPTKLYEYFAACLPVLLENWWPWVNTWKDSEPFLFVDFQRPDFQAILNQLNTRNFYTSKPERSDWASEEPKLILAIENL